ncbi:MAG: tetratricopeptide repeat protein [Burkholderiaceae bacterium]|nr:tetratricopeptide repeat protein [Burkholderiaceae bacterium]
MPATQKLAHEAAREAAQQNPQSAEQDTPYATALARARQLVEQHDYAQALAGYESLLAQRPDDDDLLIEVARVLGFADRNAESAALYRRVLDVAPQRRADVRRSLAWQTLWSGEPACAEGWFLESAALDANAADAWRGVAESRQQREDLRGALDAYEQALRIAPDDATNARRAAQLLVWLGRTDEGIAAFEALLARDPGDRRSRLGLARALNDAGRHRDAVHEYRRAQASSLDDDSRFDFARALRWSGFDDLADDELATIDRPDAQWLRRFRTSRERARWWALEFDASTDRDNLDTRSLRATAGWHFDGGRALETSLRRVRLDDPNGRVDGVRWQTQASTRLGELDSRWGVAWPSVALALNDYDGWQPLTGAARVRWLPRDNLRVDAELGRETIETPKAIGERVHVDVASIGVDLRPAIAWTLAGSLAHFRFDDGNGRDRVYGRIERTILAAPRVRAGVEALAFRSYDPIGPAVAWRGYWNPKEYREARAFVSMSHDWREWQLYARVGLGTAREVDGWDTRTSGTPNLWELAVVRDLSPTLQLRAQLGGSGSGMGLSGGGSGYWRRYAGIALTGWF